MTERTRNAKASKSNLDELEQALKKGGKSRLDQFEVYLQLQNFYLGQIIIINFLARRGR
jgi:hypothetical protein